MGLIEYFKDWGLQLVMRVAKIFIKSAVIVALLTQLVACGGGNQDLHSYIKEVKQRPGRPIEPIPKFKPVKTHTYSSATKRSPFKRALVNSNNAFQPDLKRVKEPLESYALDSLHMVGTISRDHQIWALIQTPDAKTQPVKIGNYLGLSHGRVVSITADEVKIVETVHGPNGWEKRPAALVIAKDEKS